MDKIVFMHQEPMKRFSRLSVRLDVSWPRDNAKYYNRPILLKFRTYVLALIREQYVKVSSVFIFCFDGSLSPKIGKTHKGPEARYDTVE